MTTLDVEGAACLLHVSANTVRELANRGELPGARIGHAWVFVEADLVDWLRDRAREQAAERRQRRESVSEGAGVLVTAPRERPSRRRAPPVLP